MLAKVCYMFGFGCWPNLTCDLSQEITVLINRATVKMTIIFAQNDNIDNFE